MKTVKISPMTDSTHYNLERKAQVLNVSVDVLCDAILHGYAAVCHDGKVDIDPFIVGWCQQINADEALRASAQRT